MDNAPTVRVVQRVTSHYTLTFQAIHVINWAQYDSTRTLLDLDENEPTRKQRDTSTQNRATASDRRWRVKHLTWRHMPRRRTMTSQMVEKDCSLDVEENGANWSSSSQRGRYVIDIWPIVCQAYVITSAGKTLVNFFDLSGVWQCWLTIYYTDYACYHTKNTQIIDSTMGTHFHWRYLLLTGMWYTSTALHFQHIDVSLTWFNAPLDQTGM